MGYAVDIFISQPPACYNCAVCHDVLQSAVIFKCGHSFCEDCAKACFLSTRTCPNCRIDVTDFFPNFIVRDSIGSMEVKCPHGCDESNKRARGNDGEAVPLACGCNWSGKCEDLQNHENVCDFKMIRCSIDGCNHECRRKDMNVHLSGGDGFIRHMNLMKQSITARYESKMKEMEKSHDKEMAAIKKKYNVKIRIMEKSNNRMKNSCNKKIEGMKQSIIALEDEIQKSLPPEAAAAFAEASKKRHLGTNDIDYGDSDSDDDPFL
eukprot:scaffold30656_cov62-Cyclotella_meneghiniana.AAC.6